MTKRITKSGADGVGVHTNLDFEIVFTKDDLPLLKEAVEILESL